MVKMMRKMDGNAWFMCKTERDGRRIRLDSSVPKRKRKQKTEERKQGERKKREANKFNQIECYLDVRSNRALSLSPSLSIFSL